MIDIVALDTVVSLLFILADSIIIRKVANKRLKVVLIFVISLLLISYSCLAGWYFGDWIIATCHILISILAAFVFVCMALGVIDPDAKADIEQ